MPFSMTISDPNPSFKVTVFFNGGYLKRCFLYGERTFQKTLEPERIRAEPGGRGADRVVNRPLEVCSHVTFR